MPAIKLIILFDSGADKISVTGPIEQRTLCYGMLERAKEDIALYHAKKANGVAIVAVGAAMLREENN